ncbi:plasmid mobilization protein [Cumulibacter manganitolerans]|uniref:plasmid mobilization protein n=1 Tax=Cumulibacter manganitolerans TaxID=1884992 RepID=UPI0012965150|nr:hypothetical protein [Cumulibacter manganitolerans]
MATSRDYVPPTRAFQLRLTESQHQQLKKAAADAGMTVQAYLEKTVFGEVRPRAQQGPRPHTRKQEELPLTG